MTNPISIGEWIDPSPVFYITNGQCPLREALFSMLEKVLFFRRAAPFMWMLHEQEANSVDSIKKAAGKLQTD